jgi:hypothetical protein
MSIFRNVISWFSLANVKATEDTSQWDQELLKSDKIDETSRVKFLPPEQQYIIKIDGKYYVFGSKKEMPEDLRKGVELVENSDAVLSTYTVIRKGVRETFADLSDLPPKIRELFDEKEDNNQ